MLQSLCATLASLLVALSLSACSGIDVSSDHAQNVDFAAFRTYAWKSSTVAPRAEGDIVADRIRRAVDGELAAKGLREVAPADASLLVTQHLDVEQRFQLNDPYYAYASVQTYEEGTLVLDLVDARTEKLVWRGTGQSRLSESSSAEERDERVEKVVRAILEQYPPAAR